MAVTVAMACDTIRLLADSLVYVVRVERAFGGMAHRLETSVRVALGKSWAKVSALAVRQTWRKRPSAGLSRLPGLDSNQ